MPEDIATQDVVGQDLSESEKDKEKIRKLEAQVFQLKNIIVKLTGQKEEGSGGKKQVWSLFSHISLSTNLYGSLWFCGFFDLEPQILKIYR